MERSEAIKAFRDWAISIITPALLALTSWLLVDHIAMGNRVTAIEASRYTERDAAADRKHLSEMLGRMATKDEVGRIRQLVDKINDKLDRRP